MVMRQFQLINSSMRNTYFLFLVALQISLSLASGGPIKQVIIDVDAGIDDVEALAILVNADSRKQIIIEAITCTDGNTKLDNVKKNVMRFLEQAGRTDIPVYAGSFLPLLPTNESLENFFGTDGFGDLTYRRNVTTERIKETLSPTIISELVQQHPGQITVICLGPLTNLGVSLRMYRNIPGKLKEIFIMGGNYGEQRIEFNFLADPEGAEIVLGTAGVPITILTWQGCNSVLYTYEWFFNLPIITNPVWNLVDRAERNQFGSVHPQSAWVRCDPILVAAFLYPEIITSLTPARIRVDITNQRGLVVQKPKGSSVNAKIIQSFDGNKYPEILLKAFDRICEQKCRYLY